MGILDPKEVKAAEERPPLKELDFGPCPWCGAVREAEADGIQYKHPPEDCCIEAVVWQLAWRYNNAEYQATVPNMMNILRGKLDAEGLTGAPRRERVMQALRNIKAKRPQSIGMVDDIGRILGRQHAAGQ